LGKGGEGKGDEALPIEISDYATGEGISFSLKLHDVIYGRPPFLLFEQTLHRGPIKNAALFLCPHLCQLLTDFQNSFTGTLCGQFAIM